MAPWILLELMAEQRQREAERAVEHAFTRALARQGGAGAVRSWLARTLYTAAMCLDRSVAGSGTRAARHAA